MIILVDARMYGLENTGIGRYLIQLIEGLKSLSITSKTGKSNEYVILLKKKYYDTLAVPDNWKKVLVNIPHYTLREQLLLPSIIRKYKPNLVHFPHINVPILYSGKYVLTVHDLTMQRRGINASKLPLPLYFLKRIPFLLVAKIAVKNAVKIMVPSKTTATDLANYINLSVQKIIVTYEGYDFKDLLTSRLRGELSVISNYGLVNKDYFFYIGNAHPHKNLEIVVRAIKDINETKKINAIFVIAGLKDFFIERLENYINDIGASMYVKLVGYVKDEDLPIMYKNSLGFVYPSLSEGFGLQGLEAISMGTMLACSNIPVFKEIYDFHAFYFDPRNMESISGALYSICNMSRVDKQKYTRNAQKHIEKYSWKKMAEETLQVYKNVACSK
ncbi:MAG: glycosyl transferase, group 1 [Microgenomates group bacterium GW2011_GWF1_38_5]|nr:MAG: glycosyl transferase, group 1 [Microgenomates group bacterium GW2011_GWF1_38_5]